MDLNILSAGAAKDLFLSLQQIFSADAGVGIHGDFGPVGAIHEKLLAGTPCDVVVLTAPLIEELIKSGHVFAGSSAPLGCVRTGIAVRTGEPVPDIVDRAALAKILQAAKGIYVPDTEKSTAGIHFANTLKKLGIDQETAPHLRTFPNGATAMASLAQSTEASLIGCTQITEIKYTKGVTLVGPLPKEFELATIYTIAVAKNAKQPELARRLVELLSGPKSAKQRAAGGFEF